MVHDTGPVARPGGSRTEIGAPRLSVHSPANFLANDRDAFPDHIRMLCVTDPQAFVAMGQLDRAIEVYSTFLDSLAGYETGGDSERKWLPQRNRRG